MIVMKKYKLSLNYLPTQLILSNSSLTINSFMPWEPKAYILFCLISASSSDKDQHDGGRKK